MDITRLIPAKLEQIIGNPSKNLHSKVNSIDLAESEANPLMDTVTISDEAKELRYNYQELLDQLKRSRESTEAAKDSSQDYIKCLVIAQRIMSGDRVPLKDEKFLAENQPELYLRSILMKARKVDPKKHKSLIQDEEDDMVLDLDETKIASGDDSPSVDIDIELSVDMEE